MQSQGTLVTLCSSLPLKLPKTWSYIWAWSKTMQKISKKFKKVQKSLNNVCSLLCKSQKVTKMFTKMTFFTRKINNFLKFKAFKKFNVPHIHIESFESFETFFILILWTEKLLFKDRVYKRNLPVRIRKHRFVKLIKKIFLPKTGCPNDLNLHFTFFSAFLFFCHAKRFLKFSLTLQ